MNRAPSIRALVLAAGRGERLRPLSDEIPKPLLPVLGVPVIERTLRRLAGAGVEAAAVNLHHLGGRIATSLGGEVEGMPVSYSREREFLGTLGPLARLRSFFTGASCVLLVNGDSLCEWPVEEVVEAQRAAAGVATLLLSAAADVEEFGGGVSVDARGRVLSLRGAPPRGAERRGVFAGLHALSTDLLQDLVERPSDIVRDLYEPRLEAGAVIHTVFTELPWHDLGTPRRYLEAVLRSAEAGGGWRHEESTVGESANVARSVLESRSCVAPGARVESALLLRGARVGAGGRVRDAVVGPGVEVPAGARVEGELLTAGAAGGKPVRTPL